MTIDLDRLRAQSVPFDEMIAERTRTDPEFRTFWENTAFANAVAAEVIRYRAQHDMSQEDLAAYMNVSLDDIDRLELGEEDPDVPTLRLLSARLGLRFMLDIHPADPSGAEVTYSVA